jgi:MFS family permease
VTNTNVLASWRYKEFRAYFAIRFFFTFGSVMQATIIGFYVYQLTHSKIDLALIGLSEVIPALGLALYGGHVTDKSEKRRMLLTIHCATLLTTIVLLAVTLKNLEFSTPIILMALYSMLFFNGIARAFYEPAIYTVFAHSIPKEVYPNANAWNNASWQAATIAGPTAGGFIYAFGGIIGITFVFAVIICLLLIALIFVFRLPQFPAHPAPEEPTGESIKAGLRFVFRQPMMLYAMSLDLFCTLFGGVTALLPVYALDILHIGATGLGEMRMAQSAGAALVMVAFIRISPMGKPWRNLLIAVLGFGISIIFFGLSRSFYLSLILLAVQGGLDSVSVMIRGTLMQLLTPDEMRGRVAAVNGMFIGSSSEIGDFESGISAKLLGTVPAVLFGGGMTLLIVGFTYFRTRKLLGLGIEEMQTTD